MTQIGRKALPQAPCASIAFCRSENRQYCIGPFVHDRCEYSAAWHWLCQKISFCHFLTEQNLGLWALAIAFFFIWRPPLSVFGLPGSLGRFVDLFRSRGQLKNLLCKRIALGSFCGTAGLIGLMMFDTRWTSYLVFGDEQSFIRSC